MANRYYDWGAFFNVDPLPMRTLLPPDVIYAPTIDTLRGFSTSLEAVATVRLSLLTLIFIFLASSYGSMSQWRLVSGAADVTDPDGQVAPLDYNVGTNDVHWEKAGGL